ncbi:MAG: miniconductance mechanosensitive channel [Crocinitomicaceae bacterium]|jgi:miniconductance mechanosensitive channel
MRAAVIRWIKSFYLENGELNQEAFDANGIWWTLGLIGGLIIASILVWLISQLILNRIVHVFAAKTKATWDDHLVDNKVFKGLALLVPMAFMEYFLSIALFHYPNAHIYTDKLVLMLIIIVVIMIINRSINALRDILGEVPAMKDKPLQSYSQVLKIIFSAVMLIIMVSVLSGKSPVYILTGLGAISAILLLIFKDTLLGFVGSIQLTTLDMIRLGDWITMERYGADGEVEEINLTTVKVRNWDMTITTIPTYSFISDSFKNWRGMADSDGRRVTRSLKIQIDSIKFASNDLINKLKKVELIGPFIAERQLEIETYNKEHNYIGDNSINGRQLTNVGLFRHYMEYFLRHNEHINNDMTLIVHQMEPTEYGLPLEVYCFTLTKEWDKYENVISDAFDHFFAIVNEFELLIYERPTGQDMLRSRK